MSNFRKIILIVILPYIFSGCSIKGGPWGKHEMPPLEVETIKIKVENKSKYLKAVGSLESPQSTELTSENAGKIVSLNILEGKVVNKGHVLAQIEDSTLRAGTDVAKAKLKNAEENYNRMKILKNEGAVSQQTLDNALETFDSAKGEMELATSKQAKSVIRAPYTGALSLKKVSLGAYIDPGDVIVRISQIDPLNLIFSLPEQYVSQIKVSQNIKFTVSDSSENYQAKVSVIDPYIDPNTRTVNIKAVVANPKQELLPGRFADIFLEVANIANAISIPQEALIQEGDTKKVAIVTEKNIVTLKEITATSWEEDSVLVSEGLMAGDVVITSGHQKVQEGSMVIPRPYTPIHNKQLDKEAGAG